MNLSDDNDDPIRKQMVGIEQKLKKNYYTAGKEPHKVNSIRPTD